MSNPNYCRQCGEPVAIRRWELGYKFCLPCGDKIAHKVIRCVVPLHKSNYILVTDKDLLTGVNNKGGLVK